MNPQISILLPSLRPEAVAKTIYEFDQTNFDVDYEIIVVSPFKVQGIKTVWIKEEYPLGTIVAVNKAFEKATGRYVVYFSDDVYPTEGCLQNMINFMDIQSVRPLIGAFKMETRSGKEIGPFGAYNRLYACYGCMTKQTAKDLGGYLSADFRDSWADIDISLRCWEMGGRVAISQSSVIIPNQIEDDIYKTHRANFSRDFEIFLSKWHDKLGKGIERKDGAVNHKL